jgi:stage V sporulation protein R
MFKDIERRWNAGQHGSAWENIDTIGSKNAFDDKSMKGREKIFEVRRIYNDVSFIDEFLTEEFVEKHKMYQHARDQHTGELKIVSRDFKRVKQTLLHYLTNAGQPFIYVVDANYLNRGELVLAHKFTGVEVELERANEVMQSLRLIWGRPVHLAMMLNEEQYFLSMEEVGGKLKKQRVNEEMPPPAHVL